MSIDSIQRQIDSQQREIRSLQRQLSNEATKEAEKSSRIASVSRSISSSKSHSTIQSKQREKLRLENDIANIQKKKADIQKKIAEKTSRMHRYQQDLVKEQNRATKKFQDALKRSKRDQDLGTRTVLSKVASALTDSPKPHDVPDPEHDAFISHASEDKDDLVRPLADALQSAGHDIWYDEFSLTIGDSLRKSIDKGLANSKFGIVVLSPSFFAKQMDRVRTQWPCRQGNGRREGDLADLAQSIERSSSSVQPNSRRQTCSKYYVTHCR